MDYQKLSDAIRLCGSTPKIHECKEKCPYYAGGDMMKCIPAMTKDAADALARISVLAGNSVDSNGLSAYKSNTSVPENVLSKFHSR